MENNDENNSDVKSCANCQRRLQLGGEAFCVEEGVIGPRGIVPLEPMLIFCSPTCVAEFHADPLVPSDED